MPCERVQFGQGVTDHIVNGTGQGALPREVHVVRGPVVPVLIGIDVLIAYVGVPGLRLHNQAVVVNRPRHILLDKIGVHVRVPFFQGHTVAAGRISVQQSSQGLIFLAALHQPIDGDVLVQSIQQLLCLLRHGEHRPGGDVKLRRPGRQRVDQQIGHHGDHHHNGRRRHTVSPHPEGAGPQRCLPGVLAGFFPVPLGQFPPPRRQLHSLHLLFSRDCTPRKRNTPMTVRK